MTQPSPRDQKTFWPFFSFLSVKVASRA